MAAVAQAEALTAGCQYIDIWAMTVPRPLAVCLFFPETI